MLATQQLIEDIVDNNPTSTKRNRALGMIAHLSRNDENRAALCAPELGLAQILTDLLSAGALDFEGLTNVVTTFAEWAALKENKRYLCREEFGLSKLLFELIGSPHLKDSIFIFFLNCALEPENHEYLLSERLGMAMYARQQMLLHTDWVYPYWFFTNVAGTMVEKDVPLLLDWRIHEIFMNRLIQQGPNPAEWYDRNQGSTYRSLFSVFYFAIFVNSNKIVQELARYTSYFKRLYFNSHEAQQREHYPAAIILCILSSSSKSSFGKTEISLLQFYPMILDSLITIFYTTFFYSDKNDRIVKMYRRIGYNYGIFKLRSVTFTLKELALHPSNQQIMLEDPFLLLLIMKGIDDYMLDLPECSAVGIYYDIRQHAGGGGGDIDSIENLLEILLQLFHFFAEDKTLIEFFDDFYEGNKHLYFNSNDITDVSSDVSVCRRKILLSCSPPVPLKETLLKLKNLGEGRKHSFKIQMCVDIMLKRLSS